MSIIAEIRAAMDRPKQLVDLQVNEISLVTEPANRGSRILFTKRATPGDEVLLLKADVTVTNTIEDTPTMTKNHDADLAELLMKGTDAVHVAKSDADPLTKMVAWLARYSTAEESNDTMAIAKLETAVPTVSDVDHAIGALGKKIQIAENLDQYPAYMKAINSTMGREFYAFRDTLVKAGDNAITYAAQRQNVRDIRNRGY